MIHYVTASGRLPLFRSRPLRIVALALLAAMLVTTAQDRRVEAQPQPPRPKATTTRPAEQPPAQRGTKKQPTKKPENKPKKPTQPAPASHAPPHTAATPSSGHAPTRPGDRQLAHPTPSPVNLRIERLTLDNGLRIVLSPDRSRPSLAIVAAYAAGPACEAVGQNGVARLVASLMESSASSRVGPGEHRRLIHAQGGTARAMLTRDQAIFVDLLPPGALELGLWLESSRMMALALPDDVVDRARREPAQLLPHSDVPRVLDDASVRLQELVFQGYWPYEHADRSRSAELPPQGQSAVRDFHLGWYTPGNAVLTVTGDFDPDEAIRLVRKLFADIPRRDAPPLPSRLDLPEQANERSVRVEVGEGAAQGLIQGWAIPPSGQPDHDAAVAAAAILRERLRPGARSSARRATRLHPDTTVHVAVDARLSHALLTVALVVPPGVEPAEQQAAVDGAVEELARLGPTADEMRRAWSSTELAFLGTLASFEGRAIALARAEFNRGDARTVKDQSAALLAVSRDDVRKAAARQLVATRRSLVELRGPTPVREPSRSADAAGGGPTQGAGAPSPKAHGTHGDRPGARKPPGAKPPKKKRGEAAATPPRQQGKKKKAGHGQPPKEKRP